MFGSTLNTNNFHIYKHNLPLFFVYGNFFSFFSLGISSLCLCAGKMHGTRTPPTASASWGSVCWRRLIIYILMLKKSEIKILFHKNENNKWQYFPRDLIGPLTISTIKCSDSEQTAKQPVTVGSAWPIRLKKCSVTCQLSDSDNIVSQWKESAAICNFCVVLLAWGSSRWLDVFTGDKTFEQSLC